MKNELNAQVAGLEINEGDLLIFPGYLPHKVAKNESDEDRIVISFNVDIKYKKIYFYFFSLLKTTFTLFWFYHSLIIFFGV